MRHGKLCVAVVISLWVALAHAEPAARLEMWLASSDSCNSCAIFEDLALLRGYGDELVYRHEGEQIRIPIRRVKKSAIPPELLAQLSDNSGPSSNYWLLQLTVIVARGDKVLHFGNIGDSLDIRTVQIPRERMMPPKHPPAGHPSLQETTDYKSLFLQHWNLEYFAAVALGHRAANSNARLVDFDAVPPARLGRAGIILWGAAETPIRNRLFVARRIRSIRSALQRLPVPGLTFTTLYGHGSDPDANDTSTMSDGKVSFTHPDMPIDFGADLPGIDAVFSGIEQRHGQHTLLVHVGHSGPNGIPIWGLHGTVTPEDFAALGEGSASDLIMVSGGCHSGIFARSVQCGFFAAHPEVISTGCQISASAIEGSDDYLRLFFNHISNSQHSLRLSEAHWHASVRLEDHQLSYTTVDALADSHFATSPARLPPSMSVAEIRALRSAATSEEAKALDALTEGLALDFPVALTDIVERNHGAQAKLQNARELSSQRRNEIIALPYKLMLPMLARRLVFRHVGSSNKDLQRATQCESQSIADALR